VHFKENHMIYNKIYCSECPYFKGSAFEEDGYCAKTHQPTSPGYPDCEILLQEWYEEDNDI